MTPAFERVQELLKKLPGLGYRSAERLALHLLVEKPERLAPLVEALQHAARTLGRCEVCGNLAEGNLCGICADPRRDAAALCVVDQVPDLKAMERAGAHRGRYHVLHGKLSPLHQVGPEDLNLASLGERLRTGEVTELILALANDIEGEATCHYICQELLPVDNPPRVTRIGFGLPSGGNLTYADATTLRSALEGRRAFQ